MAAPYEHPNVPREEIERAFGRSTRLRLLLQAATVERLEHIEAAIVKCERTINKRLKKMPDTDDMPKSLRDLCDTIKTGRVRFRGE